MASPSNSLVLLDALLLFYHNERQWVYHSRANLELAIAQLPPSPLTSRPPSPKSPALQATPPSSRWLKRKQQFNLTLEGISVTKRRRRHRRPPPVAARLLELFGDLVDSRMESCVRVTRLVRESNRSMLYSL